MKYFCSSILVLFLINACSKSVQKANESIQRNQIENQEPYLILISLDGYRWDYTERFNPPNISKFIQEGVQAESLIPCFPTKTFPNHYSIATGMYPDKHGLVDNNFYSPEKAAYYKTRDREKVENGKWYGGTPIWVHAENNGLISACYFFVGSEADIQGIRPTYYFNYDGSVSNEKRVTQALDWLKLPLSERPRMITLYFSDMDDAGHRFGPNNDEELQKKLFALDMTLGKLFDGVKATGLNVNIIIVSDHGMLEVPIEHFMPIEQLEDEDQYQIVSNGAIAHVYVNQESDLDKIYRKLKNQENHFEVYKTVNAKGFDQPPTNPNWGDIQIIPDKGWYFTYQRSLSFMKNSGVKIKGEHGYSPESKELHGIFYAKGTAINKAQTIPSIKNIHIFPLMCHILGLDVPKNIDGTLEQIGGVLK